MQRRDEHRAAKTQPLRASSGVAHGHQRIEDGHLAQMLLLRPGALEAEQPRHAQERAEAGQIECAIGDELGDGNRKSHRTPLLVRPLLC